LRFTVLIVGGSGSVGSKAAELLAASGDVRVIVAGRSLQKAQAVAARFGGKARHIDLARKDSWDGALSAVDLALVCMDQRDAGFAGHVLSRSIHYVDITADDRFFRAVEALPEEAVRATAVLSVGLAPGITNLLALDAASRLDKVESIEIGLLLGLGDSHGQAAVDWTMREIFAPRSEGSVAMDFGLPWGRRRAHWMDFADQHALRRTMPGVTVTTRLAFDSRLVTATLFALGAAFRNSETMMRLASRLSPNVSFGSDACVAVAEALGTKDGEPAAAAVRFSARKEAEVTAHVAAIVVRLVLEREERNGVFHVHQLFEPASLLATIERETAGMLSR
jgi:saccharopine dehydrogenase (NAD+, L-lysine-forming)